MPSPRWTRDETRVLQSGNGMRQELEAVTERETRLSETIRGIQYLLGTRYVWTAPRSKHFAKQFIVWFVARASTGFSIIESCTTCGNL